MHPYKGLKVVHSASFSGVELKLLEQDKWTPASQKPVPNEFYFPSGDRVVYVCVCILLPSQASIIVKVLAGPLKGINHSREM